MSVCVCMCAYMYTYVCVCACMRVSDETPFINCYIQLKVRPHDLQLCSETSTGVESTGQFQWEISSL